MGVQRFVVAADVATSKVERGVDYTSKAFFSAGDAVPTTGHWYAFFQVRFLLSVFNAVTQLLVGVLEFFQCSTTPALLVEAAPLLGGVSFSVRQ